MKNIKKYYQNKKVLITGHTGFKGTWLASTLCVLGAKVYGLSLNNEKGSHYNNLNLGKRINNKKT